MTLDVKNPSLWTLSRVLQNPSISTFLSGDMVAVHSLTWFGHGLTMVLGWVLVRRNLLGVDPRRPLVWTQSIQVQQIRKVTLFSVTWYHIEHQHYTIRNEHRLHHTAWCKLKLLSLIRNPCKHQCGISGTGVAVIESDLIRELRWWLRSSSSSASFKNSLTSELLRLCALSLPHAAADILICFCQAGLLLCNPFGEDYTPCLFYSPPIPIEIF